MFEESKIDFWRPIQEKAPWRWGLDYKKGCSG
jgi:hypothetical protein